MELWGKPSLSEEVSSGSSFALFWDKLLLVFLGCCNKVPHSGLNNINFTNVWSPVLETRDPRSMCQQDCLSPSWWWCVSNLRHSLACGCITLICVFTFVWCLPCVHAALCPKLPYLQGYQLCCTGVHPNDLFLTISCQEHVSK